MSTIDAAKAAINYQPANKRPGCNNCNFGEERFGVTTTWWCGRSNFLTTALSVCNQHQKRREVAA